MAPGRVESAPPSFGAILLSGGERQVGQMRTEGRMIRKSISNSKGFASLSKEAAVLFCLLIPHLNSHGKMNGGPGYIKDEVCPRIIYLTLELLPSLLREISEKTNIKWFDCDGRQYIHSVNFLEKHQNLPLNKIGKDVLPSYSRVTPELLHHEVEVEVKEKEKPPAAPQILSPENPKENISPAFDCLLEIMAVDGDESGCRKFLGKMKSKFGGELLDKAAMETMAAQPKEYKSFLVARLGALKAEADIRSKLGRWADV